ncbi:hypothetical protein H9Q74_004115 [Fusarium xylarioides]|nr:hypothetical protein H9Q71_004174 [Fusarium xylarioides]KAG5825795.1 hypothetical protein H9Q74_004115 [Fusarium xylarioides]
MDWGQSQISQAIRHLDFNLSTKWEQAFKLFADAQTDGVQRHLQAGFSNQEHIIRKILEDSAADRKITIQSPHPPEASDKSLLAGSQVQQVAAESDQHAEIEQLTLQLKTAEAELTAVKSQLEEAEIRTDQLRKLIIPTEPEPILDSKIQQLFSEIRTLTQRAVSKLYNKPPRYWDTRTPYIHNCSSDEKLQSLLGQTEEALMEAIGAKYPGERHMKEIQEWRSVTFKCTELLQDTSTDPSHYAAHLADFFKPAETDDPKSQQRGREYLQTLCERSFELGALMRRTEDTFEVFSVQDGTPLLDCEDIAEKWRSYSDKDASGVEITVCCLFGGLRKTSKEYPTKPVVLEKAQVATQFVRRVE